VSIADNLIADEAIEFSTEKHWMAPLRDSWIPLLMLLGAFLVNWASPDASTGIAGTVGNLMDLVRLGLFVGAVGWIVYNIVVWRTAEFAVTNLRVIREEGFVSRRSSATLITGISDVKAKVGLMGKGLAYGDLEIYTQSGNAGADHFSTIKKAEAFRNAIMTRKLADAGGGPAAKAAAAATSAATPGAAPVAPAAATDPMAALNSLADLRDRGAITPEEYEAKKAELLARM
jgi:uncharacterized membrane protein YdbT with pleckstrin-like domain